MGYYLLVATAYSMEEALTPLPLFADMGVPILVFTFPAMLALLVPIIFVEAWLCRRWLGVSTWAAVKSNAVANLVSTLLGVPFVWLLALVLEFFVFGTILRIPSVAQIADKWHSPLAYVISTILSAAWLGPDERNLYWMIPVAATALLVPTFFMSVWIETFIIDHMLSTSVVDPSSLSSSRIRLAVRNANLVTYGMMVVGSAAWLVISLVIHRG